MPISNAFQKRFNDLVSEKELPKTKIAKDMGVDYRTFSNAINYGILPKPLVLARISDYFHISIAYLLGQTDDDTFYPAENPSTFHERFELLKKEKNVTHYKIAKDCHFDKSCISKWFTLNQTPSLELLEILADYFGVSLDYLIGRSEDK